MICNNCGAKNSNSRTKCFNCGASLEYNSDAVIQDSFTVESTSADVENNEPVRLKRTGLNSHSKRVSHYNSDDCEPDVYPARNKKSVDGAYNSDGYDDVEYENDVEEYDNDADNDVREYSEYDYTNDSVENVDDEFYDDDTGEQDNEIAQIAVDSEGGTEQYFENVGKKKNIGITVMIWILVLVFLVVAIFAGTLVYSYFLDKEIKSDPSANAYTQLNIPSPKIEKLTDESGTEYISAEFFGISGDRLYLGCSDSYHTFVSQSIVLKLYLKDLFSSEYEFMASTVNANLNAYYVRDGKKYAYNIPSFTMSVPEAEFELLTPKDTQTKAYRDKYDITLWAQPGSKILLNNNNITSYMDAAGNITYPVDVSESSNTTYQIEVSQPYHTPASRIFIISRDALKVNLTIATSNASVIHDNYIIISGSTEPDAVISSNLPIVGSVERNALYNTFTAKLDLSSCQYGTIEAMITAENSKGKSTKSHIFVYWPDETKVTSSAQKFDSAVASNPSAYKNKNYVIKSLKITKVLSANKYEGVCTLNGAEYTVVFDYKYKQTNLVVGSSYKVFAGCSGTMEDGKPMFNAWYIYNA